MAWNEYLVYEFHISKNLLIPPMDAQFNLSESKDNHYKKNMVSWLQKCLK